MSDEDLFQRYDAQLKANQDLDYAYYVKPKPTTADRAAYYARQERVANLRLSFYVELEARRVGKMSVTAQLSANKCDQTRFSGRQVDVDTLSLHQFERRQWKSPTEKSHSRAESESTASAALCAKLAKQ